MSEDTTRLKLPFIAAAQAQKHVTHNEALLALDVLVQAAVLDRDMNIPPASPAKGDAYIVAATATGDWAGHEGDIAAWVDGVWRFHAPAKGWRAWVADEDALYIHDGAAWTKFEPGVATVNPVPGGKLGINTSADATNRLAVKSDAVLFSHDDVTPGSGDVQFKINKAASANTASLLFQTGWSGRAELGLAGDDDFNIKVSRDGAEWSTILKVDSATGMLDAPSGFDPVRHLHQSVSDAGGSDWWGAADAQTHMIDARSTLSVVSNRIYFAALYVPHAMQLLGSFVCLHQASSTSGAKLRAGMYHLGTPEGTDWNIGDRVVDFGAQDATADGHKIFDLAAPVTMQRGWYVTAFGISGDDAKVYFGKWHTPGLLRVFPYGTGTNARIRISGPSYFLYDNNQQAVIDSGFPSTWSANPVTDAQNLDGYALQCVMPKWRRI